MKTIQLYVVKVVTPSRDGCGNACKPPSAGEVRQAVAGITPLSTVTCAKCQRVSGVTMEGEEL